MRQEDLTRQKHKTPKTEPALNRGGLELARAWGTALAPGCPCTGPERVSKGLTGSGWGAARATAGAENNSEWPSQSEDVTEDDGVRTRLQGGGGI